MSCTKLIGLQVPVKGKMGKSQWTKAGGREVLSMYLRQNSLGGGVKVVQEDSPREGDKFI
jgi:hypothetical protein